jgi:hypothetical protein
MSQDKRDNPNADTTGALSLFSARIKPRHVDAKRIQQSGMGGDIKGGYAPQEDAAYIPVSDSARARTIRMHEATHALYSGRDTLMMANEFHKQAVEDAQVHLNWLRDVTGQPRRDELATGAEDARSFITAKRSNNPALKDKSMRPVFVTQLLRSGAIIRKGASARINDTWTKACGIADVSATRLTRALELVEKGRIEEAQKLIAYEMGRTSSSKQDEAMQQQLAGMKGKSGKGEGKKDKSAKGEGDKGDGKGDAKGNKGDKSGSKQDAKGADGAGKEPDKGRKGDDAEAKGEPARGSSSEDSRHVDRGATKEHTYKGEDYDGTDEVDASSYNDDTEEPKSDYEAKKREDISHADGATDETDDSSPLDDTDEEDGDYLTEEEYTASVKALPKSGAELKKIDNKLARESMTQAEEKAQYMAAQYDVEDNRVDVIECVELNKDASKPITKEAALAQARRVYKQAYDKGDKITEAEFEKKWGDAIKNYAKTLLNQDKSIMCESKGIPKLFVHFLNPNVPRRVEGRGTELKKPSDFGYKMRPTKLAMLASQPTGVSRLFEKRKSGGTVLIDGSGSMSLDDKVLLDIAMEVPAGQVAYYSGNSQHGHLVVYAAKGKVRRDNGAMLPFRCGGNAVDYAAIQWLMKQSKPRFMVTDWGWTNSAYINEATRELLQRLIDSGQVTVVKTLSELKVAMRRVIRKGGK